MNRPTLIGVVAGNERQRRRTVAARSGHCPAAGDAVSCRPKWHSRQIIVTPQMLGLHTAAECWQRAEKLGLTPLPALPHRQESWRLDALLIWSRANGFDCLPMLGRGRGQDPKGHPGAIRALPARKACGSMSTPEATGAQGFPSSNVR